MTETIPAFPPHDRIIAMLIKEQKAYEPPLAGNFYRTDLLEIDGEVLIVKSLRAQNELPAEVADKSRVELFAQHQLEYQTMQNAFAGTDMILPTIFISDFDNGQFITVQRFIPNPLAQYKLWERGINETLPELGENKQQLQTAFRTMRDRLNALFDRIHPLLIDVDFFILDREPWICLFDTSHFWPDKLEGKDRMRKEYVLRSYAESLLGE